MAQRTAFIAGGVLFWAGGLGRVVCGECMWGGLRLYCPPTASIRGGVCFVGLSLPFVVGAL